MKTTKAERLAYALTKGYGAVEVPSTSRKYRMFQLERAGRIDFYFIGKSGGFRTGKNVSHSHSVEHLGNQILAKHPMPDEVRSNITEAFTIRMNEWRLCLDGKVLPTIWNSKGAAEAAIDVERRRRAARKDRTSSIHGSGYVEEGDYIHEGSL